MEETIKAGVENPLATAPISGLLMKFAIPPVLSMLVDALYNVVDQIFIGQGVGYLGIAATTVTFPFATIILSIATVTSQILSAVILLAYFLKKGRIRLKRKHLRPSLKLCGQIAAFGLPACMIQVAAAILQIELNKAIVRYGVQSVGSEAALSAVGIVLRISTVVVSICVGIGVGIQPIIGFNQGAGLKRRVRETYWKAVGAATVVSLIGWLGCLLFPAGILRMFGMNDPAYMEFGIRCMRVFLFGMAVAGFQVVSSQYYLATGQALKAMVLSILRPLLLMIPLIHIFSGLWGLNGILYASPTADYLTALIVALLVGYDSRKRKEVRADG